MGKLLPILCLLLTGCASWFEDATPEITDGGTRVVDAYADKGDLVMSRAAASIEVARDANKAGSPKVVEAELGVAATYLPKPSVLDLSYAKARAAKADPDAYAKAQAVADAHQHELDNLWGKVEQEKQKAKAALDAKQMELDAAIVKQRELFWAAVGAAIVAAGIAGMVWGAAIGVTKIEAVAVIGTGLLSASFPAVLESDKATWVLIPVASAVGLRFILWIWQQARPKAAINVTTINELEKANPDEAQKSNHP